MLPRPASSRGWLPSQSWYGNQNVGNGTAVNRLGTAAERDRVPSSPSSNATKRSAKARPATSPGSISAATRKLSASRPPAKAACRAPAGRPRVEEGEVGHHSPGIIDPGPAPMQPLLHLLPSSILTWSFRKLLGIRVSPHSLSPTSSGSTLCAIPPPPFPWSGVPGSNSAVGREPAPGGGQSLSTDSYLHTE